MGNTLSTLLIKAKSAKTMKLAVAAAHDDEVLQAVIEARDLGIIEPILIGDVEKIRSIAKENEILLDDCELIHEVTLESCAQIAVKYVSSGKADFIMKGLIDTSILLKEVLNKEYGLRTNSLLSHVMIYDTPTYHKLIFLTDGGMNLQPSLEDKVKIINNAVKVCRALGMDTVKVAALAAKEKVNPKMPATVDGDKLKNMSKKNVFGENVIVDGPMALDLAVSKKAALIKSYDSEVAGEADIILVPNIEMGNGIGKAMTYFGGSKSAGVIMGAKAPVVLVSRADTHEAKLYSIALGSIVASYK